MGHQQDGQAERGEEDPAGDGFVGFPAAAPAAGSRQQRRQHGKHAAHYRVEKVGVPPAVRILAERAAQPQPNGNTQHGRLGDGRADEDLIAGDNQHAEQGQQETDEPAGQIRVLKQ